MEKMLENVSSMQALKVVKYIVACQRSWVSSETAIHWMDKTTLPFSRFKRWTIPYKGASNLLSYTKKPQDYDTLFYLTY